MHSSVRMRGHAQKIDAFRIFGGPEKAEVCEKVEFSFIDDRCVHAKARQSSTKQNDQQTLASHDEKAKGLQIAGKVKDVKQPQNRDPHNESWDRLRAQRSNFTSDTERVASHHTHAELCQLVNSIC